MSEIPKSPGRPKGSLSSSTRTVKEMVEMALKASGGARYLQNQAIENPQAFLALVGKLIPKAIVGDDASSPVKIEIVTKWMDESKDGKS